MDVTQYFTVFSTDRTVILWVASGGKEFYPLNPGILTCDLSGLPPVFIGTKLFMFGSICVVPQIERCRAEFRCGEEVAACMLASDERVFVLGQGRKAGRSIVPVLFWPGGRKPWKWGVERRRKKCLCNTVSVKTI